MMERYCLIREYPGSPAKGTIVYAPHRVQAYKDLKYKMKNKGNVSNHIFFDAAYIEKFPKFWRRIYG